MKEQILTLRAEGKTYNEIKELLKCSKATISYYCGENQKEKLVKRTQALRKANAINSKISVFKNKQVYTKVRDFQRREGRKLTVSEQTFTLDDVLKRIGESPICYLSGKSIDISDSKSYQLDHIIPATRGGSNNLDNLGILDSKINMMKNNLTVDEFLEKCKLILEFQGYIVSKRRGGRDGLLHRS